MNPEPVPILLYHSVSSDPPEWIARWTVHPTVFARHMDLVVESGRTPMTVSEFIDGRDAGQVPERPVLVTFDDGFADFATNAFPILEQRHIASTLYMTTAGLDRNGAKHAPTTAMLEAVQLRELAAAGVEIGAHSHTHPQLDAIARRRARDEIVRSKEVLEEVLDQAVETFAYPHGYSDSAVRAMVDEAGFRAACAVCNTFSSLADHRFAIARLTVERETSEAELGSWLVGERAARARRREVLRTKAWRYYRRSAPRARHARAVSGLMFTSLAAAATSTAEIAAAAAAAAASPAADEHEPLLQEG